MKCENCEKEKATTFFKSLELCDKCYYLAGVGKIDVKKLLKEKKNETS